MLRLLSCLLFVLTLSAADLTGKSEGTGEYKRSDGTPGGTSLVLNLKQTGQEVTGTVGPNADEQVPISKGKIDGPKLTFEINADDRVFKLELTLSNPARISWTFWPEECMIPSWPTIPDWVQNMLF